MPTATKERQPATPSTPRLSEVARHLVIPDGIVSSVWPRVRRRLATVDVVFDPWQDGFSMAALGCRSDGIYAASVGGVVESIPRQVGKTFKDGNLVIGLAAEFPGLRVAWTSHHTRTTTNTFQKMQGLVTRPKMRALLAPNGIRKTNGEQEIRFANGSVIMFGARSEGFGRGLDEIDILVFDEAQILGLKALEDMVPSTNQAKNPHGGLVFLLGTPPRPVDNGEAFKHMRRAALNGESPDRMYVEISADPDARWDDEAQWRKMNPSYPLRTPKAALLRMRELIPDEDSWRREAMGIWDEDDDAAAWAVWTKDEWNRCHDQDAPAEGWLTGPAYLGVEVHRPGRPSESPMTSVGVAGPCAKGEGFDIIKRGVGTDWAVPHLVALCTDPDKPVERIVIDPKGPAGSLVEPLREALTEAKAATELSEVNATQLALATGDFYDAVIAQQVWHRDRDEINEAVSHATKRNYGGGGSWLLDRRNGVDITPITAPILARYGYQMGPAKPANAEPDFLVL